MRPRCPGYIWHKSSCTLPDTVRQSAESQALLFIGSLWHPQPPRPPEQCAPLARGPAPERAGLFHKSNHIDNRDDPSDNGKGRRCHGGPFFIQRALAGIPMRPSSSLSPHGPRPAGRSARRLAIRTLTAALRKQTSSPAIAECRSIRRSRSRDHFQVATDSRYARTLVTGQPAAPTLALFEPAITTVLR